MEPLFSLIKNLAEASEDEIRAFIDSAREVTANVAADPKAFVGEGRSATELMEEMQAGVEAIDEARAELARREAEEASEDDETEDETPADEAEVDADALAELAARAASEPEAPATEPETPATEAVEVHTELLEAKGLDVGEIVEKAVTAAVSSVLTAQKAMEPEAEVEVEEAEESEEAVVAAVETPQVRGRLARPSRSRRSEPSVVAADEVLVSMTAAAEGLGYHIGEELPDSMAIANMMIAKRRQFGKIGEGTHDKVPIALADWSPLYPDERQLTKDFESDMAKIEAVVASAGIRAAFEARRKAEGDSLTASGGLCAPVTPYYSLQMISVADRPVRAALPSFSADRGGINAARPAALTAIDDAVGIISEAQDALGGTSATKTCQRIECPSFVEVDVDTIYHCLEFGNLGARTYPELVAQWNALVLAAHARMAETNLIDGIDAASTQVTASNAMDLGASAQIPSQILAAAAGMRSRHRMNPDAVLRVLLPEWLPELLVSDVYRGQFGRFEMTPERFVSLLRQANVEPTFYLDTETSGGQVFAAQSAGALLSFPTSAKWYLYPEGSFLHLDGGTLELGLVRDSVLNATNDFQIFGETFENVAFIGVESLAITSTIEDTGAVTAPNDANSVSYS